jgi:hypothetical protein
MYDGMFIVGIDTPDGQATYHYDINPYWDMFWVKELENAPEWDGHTAQQAIERISAASTCKGCSGLGRNQYGAIGPDMCLGCARQPRADLYHKG